LYHDDIILISIKGAAMNTSTTTPTLSAYQRNINAAVPRHAEFPIKAANGMPLLVAFIVLELAFIAAFVISIIMLEAGDELIGGILLAASITLGFVVIPFLWIGIRIIKPNEARVFTLFGRYIGTLRKDGIFYVNPFAVAVSPHGRAVLSKKTQPEATSLQIKLGASENVNLAGAGRRISLKTMTLVNDKQKINDLLGNPIIISIIVIWRVVDTAKAVFDVDDFQEFLSVQSDSALRNIVRMYPYDSTDSVTGNEKSLRGSSQEIAEKLRTEIQEKVALAGLEVCEARITHLAYAPEIAAAMLQRQQASAIVDARSLIVEGAVGMVQSALDKLSERDIVELDEERKAAMVSNLMVVLCGNKDAQPIVNSGSLY
jgi:regulator of protease activity HflC (stomatin/prohibitin superfamily)